MKTLFTLFCCLSLATLAWGLDPNDPNLKKKKNGDGSDVANQSGNSNKSSDGKRGNGQPAKSAFKNNSGGNSNTGNANNNASGTGRIGNAVSTGNSGNNGTDGTTGGGTNKFGKAGKGNKANKADSFSSNGGDDGTGSNNSGKVGKTRKGNKATNADTFSNNAGGQGTGNNNAGGFGRDRRGNKLTNSATNNANGGTATGNTTTTGKSSKTTNNTTDKKTGVEVLPNGAVINHDTGDYQPPPPSLPAPVTKGNLQNNGNASNASNVGNTGTTGNTGNLGSGYREYMAHHKNDPSGNTNTVPAWWNGTTGATGTTGNPENKWLNAKDANGNPIFDPKTGKMIDTKANAGTTGGANGTTLKDTNGNPIIDQRAGVTNAQTIKDANAAGVKIDPNTVNAGNAGNTGNAGNAPNAGNYSNLGTNNQGANQNNGGNFGPKRKRPTNGGSWTNGKFKTQTFNFAGKPRNNTIINVQFQAGNRIPNSQNWRGPKYGVFKTYHSEWHDRNWWQQHHHKDLVLVNGGYYYRRGLYWFPAWGYDQSASFYAYDGPIYAHNNLPPDQVVANVQTALQELGYYQNGEVDGMLGPMTRDALTQFQTDNQLEPTGSVDQPTLESLGMT